MPREDQWVAVQPEFSSGSGAASGGGSGQKIRKPTSAYQFYQKDVGPSIRQKLAGKFDIAEFGRKVREGWTDLSESEREHYEGLAQDDASRYARESHQADVAALQRREELQRQRNQTLLADELVDDDDDDDDDDQPRTRKTRAQRRKKNIDEEESSEESASDENEEEDEEEDSDGNVKPKKKQKKTKSLSSSKKKPSPRKSPAVSQKQIEYRQKMQKEKSDKDQYISKRQDELREERAAQAKRRLEFLLKQSNIFSHFGRVKQDKAKYGLKSAPAAKQGGDPTQKTSGDEGGEEKEGGPSSESKSSKSRRSKAYDDDDDEVQALEEADAHDATFLTAQPTTLGFGKMRDYQLEGLNWMIRLQENGVNGILADEMGLGKTLQSISVLVYMNEYQLVTGPHLIVVPKSTLSNWMNEIARWAPTLKAIRFHGDKNTREELIRTQLEPAHRDEDRQWNVCVTTYELCNIEKNVLSKFAWNYLIIDEAHRLKNEASAFSKTVRGFETMYRLLLTGTPLQNSLHELWALLNFLVPDVFESSEQFDEWFNLDIDDNDEKNKLISQLHKILRPFMLRRLKADVEKSLPPKYETILFTGMSKMQKDLYRNILARDIDAIHGNSGSRGAILNIVMQLRKCAGHPYLFPGVEDRTLPPLGEHLVENCGKMVVLDKLLVRLRERGHRVLLFTQMTKILDLMEDYLVMRRFPYCRIDGNTTYNVREESIAKYNEPDSEKFIFLLSTRAGGLGINLQTADVVILYDSDWNPQADLQAMDRAHRIGQKRPVQVFRLVTEHTVEEKIVERAQQKLKLDAMVVQQGRLKEKDKLSRDELLAAVRFGADKIFKSKDSSITDDDIDLIMDAGKRKTLELNEKFKAAEKGDLLDFKLDGSNVQTFEGVDYSAQAAKESTIMNIFDIGKRERKEANYNENSLYQRQIAAMGWQQKAKKKRSFKLPKCLRLPHMEEWQMYDRETLHKIQEEEEAAFKELPEETQKLATMKQAKASDEVGGEAVEAPEGEEAPASFELPPLISEERKALKEKLIGEGFANWKRLDFQNFLKASSRFGRNEYEKIAAELDKSEEDVKRYSTAFWGDIGKSRFSEHEYERAMKLVERGEKKLGEMKGLERSTRVLVSLFDNPWEELEFTYVQTKDKMYTMEEDRFLLCWCRKYGYGQWQAIRMAIRRNPNFRFNYFFRSLPVEMLSRRCEQLMKAAEKEVEQLERKAREDAGLPTEPEKEGEELPPIQLPKFRDMQRNRRKGEKHKAVTERKKLQDTADDLAIQIEEIQRRLKEISEGYTITRVSADAPEIRHSREPSSNRLEISEPAVKEPESKQEEEEEEEEEERTDGAPGPDGVFVEFPEYDGSDDPVEWKKPFTQFCLRNRKSVKASLDPDERNDKKKINGLLKEQWHGLSEEAKEVWREWSEWDKKRHARDLAIFEGRLPRPTIGDDVHVPKKRKSAASSSDKMTIPKKRKQ